MHKRVLLASGLALALAAALPVQAQDSYPSKPIRLIVPFEAGGTMDVFGREVAAQITKQSGVNIYIDNKPGANTLIGTAEAAKAAPNGYTLLNVSPSIVLNPLVKAKLPYDLDKDFLPITALGVGTGYLLVVRKDLPVDNVAQLQALAAKKADGLTYGTPGIGNALHIATEAVTQRLGVKMLHVPYKGSAGALNALTAGQVDVMMVSPATVITLAESKQVKVIAFTGESRSKEFPTVPTMKESGYSDFVINGTWVAWFAPAGTPEAIVNKIHAEVRRALADPNVAAALREGGFEPDGRSPQEFAKFVHSESQRFAAIVKSIGLAAE